ncbi:transmembrane protein, putative [Medicago truncatula]|uniref:Transmembrane protein, putative n=1 Tax=Medicago truncatula TaxID=3880 RepID=G7KHR5_MEDTR|nr:transmembrane protein, putative [Medicago truncatula]
MAVPSSHHHNNFTDHLFAALQRRDINEFRDDTKLKKGEFIAPGLIYAISSNFSFHSFSFPFFLVSYFAYFHSSSNNQLYTLINNLAYSDGQE